MIESTHPSWRSKYEVQRIDWPSMLPDLNPMGKRLEVSQSEFGKEKSSNLQVFSFRDKKNKEYKAFPKDRTTNLVRSMKNRISNKVHFIMY